MLSFIINQRSFNTYQHALVGEATWLNMYGIILKYLWYDAIFAFWPGNTALDTLPPSIYYELLGPIYKAPCM